MNHAANYTKLQGSREKTVIFCPMAFDGQYPIGFGKRHWAYAEIRVKCGHIARSPMIPGDLIACIFIQSACKLLILREFVFSRYRLFSRVSIRGFLFRLIKHRSRPMSQDPPGLPIDRRTTFGTPVVALLLNRGLIQGSTTGRRTSRRSSISVLWFSQTPI
jgi:hypothetical protein